ncbi:MAG: hypothetical protein ACRENS_13320, partial [Candidatus Eiseniibacteriota bacterium]
MSVDADFVLSGERTTDRIDRALAILGFKRHRDRYVHKSIPFFVEFPTGPLGIGDDFLIRPVWKTKRTARTLALSATDSCRDRLAAFYHWRDRQSLSAAVEIAIRNNVAFRKIREWSVREGHAAAYESFLFELRASRSAR